MNRPRVLVVEDEPNARSALAELLCDAGFDVAVAANGQDALTLLDTHDPQVLLTDVQMPKMGGLELAEVSRRRLHPPRIVYMSSREPSGENELWLSKPLDIAALLRTIALLVTAA